jgi:hypothetical protein
MSRQQDLDIPEITTADSLGFQELDRRGAGKCEGALRPEKVGSACGFHHPSDERRLDTWEEIDENNRYRNCADQDGPNVGMVVALKLQ